MTLQIASTPQLLSRRLVAASQRTFHLVAALSGAALALSTVNALVGCGGNNATSNAPHAQSAERQSDAEYDVALDFMSKQQPHLALQHVRKAISMNEDNARALYLESDIYLSFCVVSMASPDCHLDKAEADAKKAVKADDGYREAKNLLGQVYILEKKYPEAIAALTPLTQDQAYPYPHLAWGNLGWAQVLSGDLDKGIASLKNAVTNPDFCVGYYRLGVAYEKKQDWAQADQSFTQAVTAAPAQCKQLQDAWEERGHVRLRLAHNDEARSDFEQCRDIAPATSTGRACAQALAGAGTSGSQVTP